MPTNSSLSLRFYDPDSSSLVSEISALVKEGSRKITLYPENAGASKLLETFGDKTKFESVQGSDMESFSRSAKISDAVVILERDDLDIVSTALHCLAEMVKGTVLAPKTSDHYSNRPIFLMTIPKSGTHMMIGLFEAMGIKRNLNPEPAPGSWMTINDYNYHAPCKEFITQEWTNPVGRHPVFRSPGIFMYRNPLDMVISELAWYKKTELPFSSYLGACKDKDEMLLRLIDDPYIMGTIADRITRYTGWMSFSNIIPVSYEELVGSNGGGSDIEQLRTIWSIQLKLQIPGKPEAFARSVYNQDSATFNKGKIGGHKDIFKPIHFERLGALSPDFMAEMGYDMSQDYMPARVEEFRKRKLKIKKFSDELLWEQRIVRESYFGYNIISTAGQYVAISTELGSVDLAREDQRKKPGVHTGFATEDDARFFALSSVLGAVRSNRLDALVKTLDERTKRIEALEKKLGKGGELEALGKTIDERTKRIKTLEKTLGKGGELEALGKTINERTKRIKELEKKLGKGGELEALGETIDERTNRIETLEKIVGEQAK